MKCSAPPTEIALRALPLTSNERTRSAGRTVRTAPSRKAWLSLSVAPTSDSRVPALAPSAPIPSE